MPNVLVKQMDVGSVQLFLKALDGLAEMGFIFLHLHFDHGHVCQIDGVDEGAGGITSLFPQRCIA